MQPIGKLCSPFLRFDCDVAPEAKDESRTWTGALQLNSSAPAAVNWLNMNSAFDELSAGAAGSIGLTVVISTTKDLGSAAILSVGGTHVIHNSVTYSPYPALRGDHG